MIVFIIWLSICGAFQISQGGASGGWGAELGRLHYYFGIYIFADVLGMIGREVANRDS